MLIERKMHMTHEAHDIFKWVAVLTLASALALIAASVAAGRELRPSAPDASPPGTLPPDIDEISIPMGEFEYSTVPNSPPAAAPSPTNDFDRAMKLWMAIHDHRDAEVERAIAAWKELTLPCDMEGWRYVAIGAAHLENGNLEEAFEALETAESFDVTNPIVAFERGIMYLVYAATAPEWYDAVGRETRFVSRTSDTPLTRSMYERAAIMEFENAIKNAATVDPTKSLLSIPWAVPEPYVLDMPICTPLVGDLLEAIGADHFEGKAHNMLGPLYIKHGALSRAEHHMDRAVDLGMNVLDGYTELGDKYHEHDRNGDAFRAYLKAATRGNGLIAPVRDALKSLRPLPNDL